MLSKRIFRGGGVADKEDERIEGSSMEERGKKAAAAGDKVVRGQICQRPQVAAMKTETTTAKRTALAKQKDKKGAAEEAEKKKKKKHKKKQGTAAAKETSEDEAAKRGVPKSEKTDASVVPPPPPGDASKNARSSSSSSPSEHPVNDDSNKSSKIPRWNFFRKAKKNTARSSAKQVKESENQMTKMRCQKKDEEEQEAKEQKQDEATKTVVDNLNPKQVPTMIDVSERIPLLVDRFRRPAPEDPSPRPPMPRPTSAFPKPCKQPGGLAWKTRPPPKQAGFLRPTLAYKNRYSLVLDDDDKRTPSSQTTTTPHNARMRLSQTHGNLQKSCGDRHHRSERNNRRDALGIVARQRMKFEQKIAENERLKGDAVRVPKSNSVSTKSVAAAATPSSAAVASGAPASSSSSYGLVHSSSSALTTPFPTSSSATMTNSTSSSDNSDITATAAGSLPASTSLVRIRSSFCSSPSVPTKAKRAVASTIPPPRDSNIIAEEEEERGRLRHHRAPHQDFLIDDEYMDQPELTSSVIAMGGGEGGAEVHDFFRSFSPPEAAVTATTTTGPLHGSIFSARRTEFFRGMGGEDGSSSRDELDEYEEEEEEEWIGDDYCDNNRTDLLQRLRRFQPQQPPVDENDNSTVAAKRSTAGFGGGGLWGKRKAASGLSASESVHLGQEIMSIKIYLLKLKRILQENEALPEVTTQLQSLVEDGDHATGGKTDEATLVNDLRKQISLLQQQNEEKDLVIQGLRKKHELTSSSRLGVVRSANAATQTVGMPSCSSTSSDASTSSLDPAAVSTIRSRPPPPSSRARLALLRSGRAAVDGQGDDDVVFRSSEDGTLTIQIKSTLV